MALAAPSWQVKCERTASWRGPSQPGRRPPLCWHPINADCCRPLLFSLQVPSLSPFSSLHIITS